MEPLTPAYVKGWLNCYNHAMQPIKLPLKSGFIDAFTLKIIAVVAMIIDHIGAVFFPEALWMREIGRIAMPLFAFLLTEGFLKTSSKKNYLKNLLIFAAISQLPYSLMQYVIGGDIWLLNIFFLFALALGLLWLLTKTKTLILKILLVCAACLIAIVADIDYSAYGIITVVAFYIARFWPFTGISIFVIATIITSAVTYPVGLVQLYAMLAIPLIISYNGKIGLLVPKMWFYWFYPAHMTLLVALWAILSLA